jgi:hypothetical protein
LDPHGLFNSSGSTGVRSRSTAVESPMFLDEGSVYLTQGWPPDFAEILRNGATWAYNSTSRRCGIVSSVRRVQAVVRSRF